MMRAKNLWLLGLLSASCVVNGFTIEDQLPGRGGSGAAGVAGSSTAGTPSTDAGTSNQGGDGVAGALPQGGKGGTAGSTSDAGSPVADAGEPSVGQGGNGEGGAPSGSIAPCDQSNGKPPLLCDDFEAGSLNMQKWSPPAGLTVSTAEGRSGSTKLVYLDNGALATKLEGLPITAAGGAVTVSFWVKIVTGQPGAPILSLSDRSAAQNTVWLNVIQKEFGWKSSGSNFSVPQAPTGAMFVIGAWTCVSVRFTYSSMVLRYQSVGAATVSTLTIDDMATPGIDANWQNLPADNRYAAGYPSFSGNFQGASNKAYLDDVRIAADTSSVCPF